MHVVFERFDNGARRAVVMAQEEARRLNHEHVGTEHLLLGILQDGTGLAARAFPSGISLRQARSKVEEVIGRGTTKPAGHIPFTPHAKHVLEGSLTQALGVDDQHIGAEHILLALLHHGEGTPWSKLRNRPRGAGATVLVMLGADLGTARKQLMQALTA